MDYGNEETLSSNQLRPLHHKFCSLPCQAIYCCLNSVFTLQEQSCSWNTIVCDWFSDLLLGKTVEVSLSECNNFNLVLLEVLLPLSEIKNSVFPSSVLEVALKDDFVCLSSLIDYIGLSLTGGYHIDSHTISERDFLHVTDLPPLIIKLNSSFEFTCLMSHVAGEAHFYVHPIQEDLANNMTFIDDELYNYYAIEENRISLPSEDLNCGILCCIYSMVFQQWCRGVIVRIKNEITEEMPTCLIFFLDYGGMEWIEACKVFSLIASVKRYPSQVACCSFDEITCDHELEVLVNPDIAGFAKNCYVPSLRQKEVLSRCVEFLKCFTEGKQLFIVVKGKGKF